MIRYNIDTILLKCEVKMAILTSSKVKRKKTLDSQGSGVKRSIKIPFDFCPIELYYIGYVIFFVGI